MNTRPVKQIVPLCSFGPGGDFVCPWPLESRLPIQYSSNPLSRLLSAIGAVITTMLDLEPDDPSACKEIPLYEYTNDRITPTTHTSPIAIIKSNRFLAENQVLFADNCGAGKSIEHKQNYRIRTYNRAAKKKPAFRLLRQGSLFEINLKSARTA